MVANPQKTHYTVEEYLAFERESNIKHEYIDGEIVAMAGASPAHNLIEANIIAALHAQLRDTPCRTYASSQRVLVSSSRYAYPDVTIVCGTPEFDDDNPASLKNPTLVVEILSPSTANYDRGQKAQDYREMPSLQTYLIVSQDRPYLEQFVRQGDGSWRYTETKGTESSLHLPSIDYTLNLADVYARVKCGTNEDIVSMAANPQKTHYTVEEYLAFERESNIKHEYIDGEIVAMAGAKPTHVLITGNVFGHLHSQLLQSSCRSYGTDLKVQVNKTRYTYPDLTIVCDDPQFTEDTPAALMNPFLIVEVLSPSTEKYDRGEKLQSYIKIPSLKAYLLVSQDKAHIEQYVLQNDGSWRFTYAEGLEASIYLPNINCTLNLADVYARVEFES